TRMATEPRSVRSHTPRRAPRWENDPRIRLYSWVHSHQADASREVVHVGTAVDDTNARRPFHIESWDADRPARRSTGRGGSDLDNRDGADIQSGPNARDLLWSDRRGGDARHQSGLHPTDVPQAR